MTTYQKKFTKNIQTEHDITIKTNKTFTSYNITDYLPPSHDHAQSKSITTFNRFKDKNNTEPYEKYKQAEANQLSRKVNLLEQENLMIKVQLQRTKRDLNCCQQTLKQKQAEIQKLKVKRQQNIQKLKALQSTRSPRLLLQCNSLHFQIFPKFKQSYQVSIQTDSYIQPQSQSQKDARGSNGSSTTNMQHIYQKLQNLKMGRKISKHQPTNLQPTYTANLKTDRARTYSNNWGNNDKQNVMRTSNIIQKRYGQRIERIREETLDLYCLPVELGQKMLTAYLDQSYV